MSKSLNGRYDFITIHHPQVSGLLNSFFAAALVWFCQDAYLLTSMRTNFSMGSAHLWWKEWQQRTLATALYQRSRHGSSSLLTCVLASDRVGRSFSS